MLRTTASIKAKYGDDAIVMNVDGRISPTPQGYVRRDLFLLPGNPFGLSQEILRQLRAFPHLEGATPPPPAPVLPNPAPAPLVPPVQAVPVASTSTAADVAPLATTTNNDAVLDIHGQPMRLERWQPNAVKKTDRDQSNAKYAYGLRKLYPSYKHTPDAVREETVSHVIQCTVKCMLT